MLVGTGEGKRCGDSPMTGYGEAGKKSSAPDDPPHPEISNRSIIPRGTKNDNSPVDLRSSASECCSECGSPILDRFYLLAGDRKWHSQCLKCSQCFTPLDAEISCFFREGRVFCKKDYFKLFAVRRCTRCGQGIYASDLVMRVRTEKLFHLSCFTCAWCNVTPSQGDYFGICGNLVYCRLHFEMQSMGVPHHDHHTSYHPFFSSENALHPSPADHPHHHHPSISGLPSVYSSIYGSSPTSGHIMSGSSSAALIHTSSSSPDPNVPVARNATHQTHTTNTSTCGPKKGRPRKRKVDTATSKLNAKELERKSCMNRRSEETNCGYLDFGHLEEKPAVSLTDLNHATSGGGGREEEEEIEREERCKRRGVQSLSESSGGRVEGRSAEETPTPAIVATSQSSSKSDNLMQQENQKDCLASIHVVTESHSVVTKKRKKMMTENNNNRLHKEISPLLSSSSSSSSCSTASSYLTSSSMTNFCIRTKRMRTSFKHHQLRQMKAYFSINHNPDSKELKELSVKTALPKRVLQVWFQNARAKWRRSVLRQQSVGPHVVEESKPLTELNAVESPSGFPGIDNPVSVSSESVQASFYFNSPSNDDLNTFALDTDGQRSASCGPFNSFSGSSLLQEDIPYRDQETFPSLYGMRTHNHSHHHTPPLH